MTFRGFVILGLMRTGSNLLEEVLNTLPGVTCHGELFNPHFVGGPKRDGLWGIDKAARDADPGLLLGRVLEADGLHGFRFFADHDPRIFDTVLADPNIAKIVLTRRAIDSFVSLSIAKTTKQWWLGDAKSARAAKVPFEPDKFESYLEERVAFYGSVRKRLQHLGQAAFWIDYADVRDDRTLAGLARFLGAEGTPDLGKVRAKVQNPQALADLLTNPDEAAQTLGYDVDLSLGRQLEPERGAGVRGYVATETGLLYMPIPGASDDPVACHLLGATGFTRKDLRAWMRRHAGHRAFTVLRSPLARAYDVFLQAILPAEGLLPDVRDLLIKDFGLNVPDRADDPGYDLVAHQTAFGVFLAFLDRNLAGQSNIPVQRIWASQGQFVAAMGSFRPPDLILRESDLQSVRGDFPELVGLVPRRESAPFEFDETITEKHRALARRAYRKDYLTFGLDD